MLLGDGGTRTARKPHRCWWCAEAIDAGTKYEWWTWKDDDVVTIKTHPECKEAWDKLAKHDRWSAEEVGLGDYTRGCCCLRGECLCKKGADDANH